MNDLAEESVKNADDLKAHHSINNTEETGESNKTNDDRSDGDKEHITETVDNDIMKEIWDETNNFNKINPTNQVKGEENNDKILQQKS